MADDNDRIDDGADETWVPEIGDMGMKFWLAFASGFSLLRGVFVVIALLALKWVDLIKIKAPTDASLVVLGVVISVLLAVDFSFLSITNYLCLKASKRYAERTVSIIAQKAGLISVVSGANAGTHAMIGVNAIVGALEKVGAKVDRVNGTVTQVTFPEVPVAKQDVQTTQHVQIEPARLQKPAS